MIFAFSIVIILIIFLLSINLIDNYKDFSPFIETSYDEYNDHFVIKSIDFPGYYEVDETHNYYDRDDSELHGQMYKLFTFNHVEIKQFIFKDCYIICDTKNNKTIKIKLNRQLEREEFTNIIQTISEINERAKLIEKVDR